MKILLALILILFPIETVPESLLDQWWDAMHLGAPCSTKTDLIEMPDCKIEVKNIHWK